MAEEATQYEYKTVKKLFFQQAMLNRLAKKGWELTSTRSVLFNKGEYVFRRPIRLGNTPLPQISATTQRSWWSRHPVIAILIAIFIFGLVTSTINQNTPAQSTSTPAQTVPSSTSQPVAPPLAPIKVTADALYSAYNQNQIAADAKYKGNLIEVTGIIDSIGKDILNNPYVALEAGEYPGPSVECMFSQSDESQLAALSSGQRVTLEGTGAGETISVVNIDGCSIVQ